MRGAADQERERFFGGVKVMAALTMVSRVLGLVREGVLAAMGATQSMGAFRVAFLIPNLFRRLFGEGALSAAFVPVFTEVGKVEGWDRARAVLANVLGLLALVLGALVVVAEAGVAVWLLWVPPHRLLLAHLTMIMLPFLFTVCLLAICSAALNCKGHFAYPAFAPVLLNLAMILAAYASVRLFGRQDWRGLFLLGGSVVAAGVVQLAGVVWMLRRFELAVVPRVRPIVEPVKRIVKLTLPMFVPMSVMQFSAAFDKTFAYFVAWTAESPALELFGWRVEKPLTVAAVTWFDLANRLYQFPLGILAISLATAVFPLFSRYAAERNVPGLREVTNRSLRLSLFMAVPAGLALMLLARPAVVLLFRHGHFTDADVAGTSMMLRMYCLGMWAYFCNHILLRAFFSQKDTRTPLWVSCVLAGVNVVLVVTLVFTPLGAAAIGLATALTAAARTLIFTWCLRRRWGRIGFRRILASLGRTAVAAACMGGAVAAVMHVLAGPAGRLAERWGAGWAAAGVVLLAAIPVGAAVYIAAAAACRCPELAEVWGTLRRRRGPAGPPGRPDGI